MANFGPSPIGLMFSVKVNHLFEAIQFFFFFSETVFKVTSKLANLPFQTLKFCYKLLDAAKTQHFVLTI